MATAIFPWRAFRIGTTIFFAVAALPDFLNGLAKIGVVDPMKTIHDLAPLSSWLWSIGAPLLVALWVRRWAVTNVVNKTDELMRRVRKLEGLPPNP